MTNRQPIVEDGVIAGNFEDKHGTRNPVARWLVARFHAVVEELTELTGARDVHEVGCGEGFLTARLARGGRRVRGSDFSRKVVDRAREDAAALGAALDFRACSVYDLDPATDAAELVVCCEVLEHLEEPRRALEVLSRLARPHLLVSVPREPLWRLMNLARGRYVRDWGNTPGHLQHWSQRGFRRMLEDHVDVVELRAPIPWTVALCRARGAFA